MSYKFTVEITPDEADNITLSCLKEAYEDCVYTLLDESRQWFDPIEDVLRRQEGLVSTLAYFMIPKDFVSYMEFWNNYTQKDYDESSNQTTGVNS
jgi:hypothetical protein